MTQTRRKSLLESLTNIAVGYAVALATQMIVFPIMGIHVRPSQNVRIGLVFTAVSLARSYWLRRFFNRLDGRGLTTSRRGGRVGVLLDGRVAANEQR